MRTSSLVTLIVGVALIGAACSKEPATTNTNSVTNTSVITNTTSTPGATTGTFATNTNTGSDTVPTPTATLTITSSGISPKTLTIARGTIVTIQNNDSRSHEITSDPHPDHTDLPDFTTAISAGSSARYTFTKTGSWGYHDHDDPFDSSWQGTVIVQ